MKQMEQKVIEALIDKAAIRAAEETIRRLKTGDKIKYQFSNSFKKTEELLLLYPNLPDDHPQKKRIDKALDKIKDDDYKDVIASRYFDGLTLAEIADIYDCKYQNISKHRNKLVKILSNELFPEEVLTELMER